MPFNLELILVALTAITGLVVAIHKFRSRGGIADSQASDEAGAIVEISRSFFPVLLVVLVIRSFLFEPYKIPSSSMVPTLLVGDFIFVSKFSYGVRLPVIHTKVIETGAPERGDVAVFRLPRDPSINYIKRVIGLPGDTIEYERGRLTINGVEMPLERGEPLTIDDDSGVLFTETLDGKAHPILHSMPLGARGKYTITVPAGHYFCMGDNRDNSQDSRSSKVGLVPEANLVGRAGRIWFNFTWDGAPRWGRIGNKIE